MSSCSPRNQKALELLVKVIQEGMGRSPSTSSTPAMVHIWRYDPPVLHQDASCQLPHVKRWPAFLPGSRDMKGGDRGILDGQKCIVDQHLREKNFIYLFLWPLAPHSSTLAWKIPWTEEPGRLQSLELLRVGHNWATSLSLFNFVHWRRKWQPTPVFLPGESQGRRSLVGCHPWGRTESDTTEAT